MGLADELLKIIGTVFGLLSIISIIGFLILILSYWSGLISGNVVVIGIIIIAFVDFIIGAMISDILQEIIEGIVKAIVAIAEAIASFIEALLGLFGR